MTTYLERVKALLDSKGNTHPFWLDADAIYRLVAEMAAIIEADKPLLPPAPKERVFEVGDWAVLRDEWKWVQITGFTTHDGAVYAEVSGDGQRGQTVGLHMLIWVNL